MKLKKIIALVLCMSLTAAIAGCGQKTEKAEEGKIVVSIGDWPTKENEAKYKEYMDKKAAFEEKYPEYEIQPDNWSYKVDTFLPKAASGKLPTMYNIPVTEVEKVINAGYALDITKQLDEYGYTDNVKEEFWELCSNGDKKYFLPVYAYTFGMYANLNLMEQIGAVEEDGTVHFPDTYEELAEMAKEIKEKTGAAGFATPTINNMGGWFFMNIAYSFGADFIGKDENGKWKANLNSPEVEAAFNYIKDLKWKYNALPESNLLSDTDVMKMYATDQVAMFLLPPDYDVITKTYGMDRNDIAIGKIPAGPEGRYALLGGGLYAFASNATQEQVEGCFKWIDFIGQGPKFADEVSKRNREASYKSRQEEGCLVGCAAYSQWNENSEKAKLEQELRAKYINVSPKNVEQFADFSDTEIKPEPEVNCQQLYTIIDNCLQQIMSDENADIKQILNDANANFQTEYLDRVEW